MDSHVLHPEPARSVNSQCRLRLSAGSGGEQRMLRSQHRMVAGVRPGAVNCIPLQSLRTAQRSARHRPAVLATAKPTGSGKGTPKPTSTTPSVARASPKKKLPAESSATQPSIQAEKQVDAAAKDAKQGVDSMAQSTKGAVDDLQTSTQGTRRAVNEQADSLQDGVDAGADALKDAIDSGSSAAQDAADEFEKRAAAAADRADANLQEAGNRLQEGIDEAGKRLDRAIDQAPEEVAGTVQQAVDTTAEGIRGARRQLDELQKPGPRAPFQSTPLTSLDPNPFENRPGPKASDEKQAEYYRNRLLVCVSGLDRGSAANTSAVAEVEATLASLLSVSQPVLLSWAPEQGKDTSSLAQLNGTWRLVYSSTFAKGNAPALPGYKLGQVYQAISAYASRLDNIVELYSTVRLPQLPGLPPIDPIVTTATLKHYFEAIGGSTVRITFEDTEVKSTGGPNGILGRFPEVSLPQLPEGFRPSRSARSSTFEVLYLDNEVRVTRGARGELRVFLRT